MVPCTNLCEPCGVLLGATSFDLAHFLRLRERDTRLFEAAALTRATYTLLLCGLRLHWDGQGGAIGHLISANAVHGECAYLYTPLRRSTSRASYAIATARTRDTR